MIPTTLQRRLLSRTRLSFPISFLFFFLFLFIFYFYGVMYDSKARGDADTDDNRGSLFRFVKILVGVSPVYCGSRDVLSFIDAF